MKSMNKKVIFVSFGMLFLAACSNVPAGNVGVKVNLYGSDKGVENTELSPGRYWIGWNEELYVFPTFQQNYTWTKSTTEQSPTDESFTFQTIEGLTVNADIGIQYTIDGTKASILFQKYRKGVEGITDGPLRSAVRDALVREASKKPIEQVYGSGKAELLDKIIVRLQNELAPQGIMLENIYWIGEMRLPDAVVTSLNEKIAATQRAQQRENEVREKEAEAQKIIAVAKGEAEKKRLDSEADAKALEILGKAIRENPETLNLRAIEKWNGELPRIMGGEGPVPFIDVKKFTEDKIP